MLFPWAFRLGWIIWWILSILVLFILSILWPEVLITKTVNNVLASKINVCAENDTNKESIEQIQGHMLPIEELLDLGFKEKYSENFEHAAEYFSNALAQNPIPDLAFSLIIDCYYLWDNMGKHDYALTQLESQIHRYLPLFKPELRFQFDTWMVKEDLQIVLE